MGKQPTKNIFFPSFTPWRLSCGSSHCSVARWRQSSAGTSRRLPGSRQAAASLWASAPRTPRGLVLGVQFRQFAHAQWRGASAVGPCVRRTASGGVSLRPITRGRAPLPVEVGQETRSASGSEYYGFALVGLSPVWVFVFGDPFCAHPQSRPGTGRLGRATKGEKKAREKKREAKRAESGNG